MRFFFGLGGFPIQQRSNHQMFTDGMTLKETRLEQVFAGIYSEVLAGTGVAGCVGPSEKGRNTPPSAGIATRATAWASRP